VTNPESAAYGLAVEPRPGLLLVFTGAAKQVV